MLAALRDLDDGRHRAEFYRLWAAGHSAGFTHPRSLEMMGPRESRPTEAAREWLLEGTTAGQDLTALIRADGRRLDALEGALLSLGEESGQLDETLRLLGDYFTRKHQLMLWVKKQMAYPFFTALAACFVAPLPLLVFGHTLTYLAIALSGVFLLAASARSLLMAAAARFGRKPPLARARMARALASAVEAGVALPRALRLAAASSSNREIGAFMERMDERQLASASIGDSLRACPHLTPEFHAAIATAEHTGDFSPLTRLADLYEDGFR